MAEFVLVRHGEPDWDLLAARGFAGPAVDIAPLTGHGISQARAVAATLRRYGAVHVVSSPMTRAMQTGSIVASALGLELKVEFDLHEWLPDTGFSWRDVAEVSHAYDDMIAAGEAFPLPPFRWEPVEQVRRRCARALSGHASGRPVIAVCHAVVIYALTGHAQTSHAGIREWTLPHEV